MPDNSQTYFPNKTKLTLLPRLIGSAGLAIVANVEIATGPALLGAPRSFVLNLILNYSLSTH